MASLCMIWLSMVGMDELARLRGTSVYRLFGARIGHGYEKARSRHIFRDFIEATARVVIGRDTIKVHFQKRAHNPLLVAADFDETDVAVPWLGNKRLQIVFG